MERDELRARVKELLAEGNYIGAFGLVEGLPKGDDDRVILVGQVARAIATELDESRSASADRQAWLRSQLAWVCREVEGLSWLYREQLRSRDRSVQDEIALALKDLASGHPEEAMDRLKHGFEEAREAVASGEAADRVQFLLKEAEQGLKEGLRSVGVFFETMRRRGESIRRDSDGTGSVRDEGGEKGADGEWVPPGKRAPGSSSSAEGFKVDIGD